MKEYIIIEMFYLIKIKSAVIANIVSTRYSYYSRTYTRVRQKNKTKIN